MKNYNKESELSSNYKMSSLLEMVIEYYMLSEADTDLVSDILLCMTSKQRAAILAEMDPVYAAKLTVIMYPAKG